MNRPIYYAYPQAYAPNPHQLYYRNEDVERKEAPVMPKNVMYTTSVELKFIEHFTQHKGLMVSITTTVGKLVGLLEDVFIDHVVLEIQGKKHYIRVCEIVYFEKAESK
ncbi:DUF2642 domain-containing protein [Paenibacillus hemerocallicola]|uniref:DUF2642 domain-containing protein n=1 Tax=Paenibacillus hemerocallicola TaxID=1172614 RepID=A0A5C4SZP1_9BACL|nr:DUF2642 domain-containing protein [Paenibacillus hemerocallicola]TNJ62136.1 DUF2642 domain-containing protein [Paenibacillus hemerocallicola]